MSGAIRDCLVTGYEPLVDVVTLPDPNDRHVLAAAIKSRAQVIGTNNIKDFPQSALEQWNVEAKTPTQTRTNRPGRDGSTTATLEAPAANELTWRREIVGTADRAAGVPPVGKDRQQRPREDLALGI
jgi:hypothetical protein